MSPKGPAEAPNAPIDNESFRTVLESEKKDFLYKLEVSKNNMQAFLSCKNKNEAEEKPVSITLPDILSILEENGIRFGTDLDRITERLEKFRTGKGKKTVLNRMLVAEGQKAVNGLDGRIDFKVNPSSGRARYLRKDDGSLNFRELNLIENVAVNQLLAKIIPPTEGIPGKNVFGEEVTAFPGELVLAKPGNNVRTENNNTIFYGTAEGRLVYENETISVSDLYQVDECVDLSIGNINFVGKVVVGKDVLDEFSVVARKGIEIHGAVGSAYLESDNDIIINGGVAGKLKGVIKAGKKLKARFLNEVTVEAMEEIFVEREILNSNIKTMGRVILEKGAIIGGEIVALCGIVAETIGSDFGVPTTVIAGVDFLIRSKYAEFDAQITEIDQNVERINKTVGPIVTNKEKLRALGHDKIKMIRTLVDQLLLLKNRRVELENQRLMIQDQSESKKVKKINVLKYIYNGTTVYVGQCRLMLKENAKGPLSLIEDIENDTVRIVPMTPMPAVSS